MLKNGKKTSTLCSRTIKDDQTSYAWKSGEILHALTKLKAVALNYEKRARDVVALARCAFYRIFATFIIVAFGPNIKNHTMLVIKSDLVF